MTARRGFVVALIALAGCAKEASPPLPAEVQPLARVELDSNRVVEIIGLRRWTADMIRDSLKKYAPDDPLESDATAANLRNLLGFADAATSIHNVVFDEDDKATITIAVREPSDSARVRYAQQALDTIPARREWTAIARSLNDTADRVWPAVAAAHLDRVPLDSPADSQAAMPVIKAITARKAAADYDAALQTIESSNSEPDRAIAALILVNFPERDGAWHALLKAAVGREQGRDAFVAQHALVALAEHSARPVDWSPMTSTIHDVLEGTALGALAPLAAALAATGASPVQAPRYLAGGGEMLTALVESENPDVRDPAHDLLVKLRGQDLGFEPGPWRDWIKTLK
jgi:hypothetical protein